MPTLLIYCKVHLLLWIVSHAIDRWQKVTFALLWGHPPAGPPQDPCRAWGRVLAQQADCTCVRHWMAELPGGGGLRALRLPAHARAVLELQVQSKFAQPELPILVSLQWWGALSKPVLHLALCLIRLATPSQSDETGLGFLFIRPPALSGTGTATQTRLCSV